MNNEFDDFSNAIDNIQVDRKKNTFEINQLLVSIFSQMTHVIAPFEINLRT